MISNTKGKSILVATCVANWSHIVTNQMEPFVGVICFSSCYLSQKGQTCWMLWGPTIVIVLIKYRLRLVNSLFDQYKMTISIHPIETSVLLYCVDVHHPLQTPHKHDLGDYNFEYSIKQTETSFKFFIVLTSTQGIRPPMYNNIYRLFKSILNYSTFYRKYIKYQLLIQYFHTISSIFSSFEFHSTAMYALWWIHDL